MTTVAVGVRRRSRTLLHLFLVAVAVAWLIPMVTALYNSFRNFEGDTLPNGPFAVAKTLTLDNYREAWKVGEIQRHLGNTLFIVLPALFLILFLSSMVAFACTRFSWRFNVFFLVLFTAGNLMPQQVIFQPLFKIYGWIPLPDWLSDTNTGSLLGTKIAVMLIHVAFQTGFCTFVLSNYMKTLPKELYEAAMVDGASIWRQYWQLTMPLCRPPLAALATLEVTWIYNEFFWATVLLQSGDKMPVTSSLNNLKGTFFTDFNLLSAGSIIAALPVLVIFFVLQKQFVSGLTLGSDKG